MAYILGFVAGLFLFADTDEKAFSCHFPYIIKIKTSLLVIIGLSIFIGLTGMSHIEFYLAVFVAMIGILSLVRAGKIKYIESY